MQGPQPVFLNVEFIFSWLWGHIFSPLFSTNFLLLLKFIMTLLIIAGITIILYCLVRIYEIKQEGKKKEPKPVATPVDAVQTPSQLSTLPGAAPVAPVRNETWENIRLKLLGESPSDWRLGIIEADIYLDRVLDSKGYYGDTLGDKLKNLTPDKLPSLQIAWEAHKVRNRIAHDGVDFSLTMPEARRTLSYYEIVFRDLEVIA